MELEAEGLAKLSGSRSQRNWRSAAQKDQLIAEWRASGVSRTVFCRERGLCYSVFARWVRDSTATVGFAAVDVVESEHAEPSERIEMISPGGWRVLVSAPLSEVISQLSRC